MPVLVENTLTVRPVAGRIGADISGVDLSRPLSPEEVPDGRESELISGRPFTADHRVVVSA
ncbi:hypothetical protein [Streptomyces flaveus]|uniref:Uncharacterized protein n=1 Tax=Streptomyces flaveus TaxID=66370 RepID=A0A917VC88_9ACTN|nr:hypothetical protein [Streptomyces flaveus]GGK60600.1 hypothetical protein GCM10010094_21240 [Streptomyces flaveus]